MVFLGYSTAGTPTGGGHPSITTGVATVVVIAVVVPVIILVAVVIAIVLVVARCLMTRVQGDCDTVPSVHVRELYLYKLSVMFVL